MNSRSYKYIRLLLLLAVVAILANKYLFSALRTEGSGQDLLKFDFVYTLPQCNHRDRASTWCTYEDRFSKHNEYNILAKLLPNEDLIKATNIFVASFIYGSKEFTDLICEQLKAGKEITLIADLVNSNHPELKRISENCGLPSDNRIKFLKLGQGGKWPNWINQHIKLFMYDNPSDGKMRIVFGSGNLSPMSFSILFNSWIITEATLKSNFAKQHFCLAEAMKKTAQIQGTRRQKREGINVSNVFNREIETCRKSQNVLPFDLALSEEGIAPLFTRVAHEDVRGKLTKIINEVEPDQEISGAFQIFSDKSFAAALQNAVRRGVKVNLILDDMVLLEKFADERRSQFYRDYLEKSGINFRFIENNKDILQLMHLRFLLLGEKMLFTGSAQLTYAAFNKNYENVYFINDKSLIEKHRALFDKLWEKAYEHPSSS